VPSFTLLDHATVNAGLEGTRASNSFTPAVGDIMFWMLRTYAAAPTYTLTGTDVTWTEIDSLVFNTDSVIVAFRVTAGGGTAGVQTFDDSAADQWRDPSWMAIRPVDLTFDGVAGKNSTASGDLTITLTTSSPAALFAFFANEGETTFNADSGWTILQQAAASLTNTICGEYRLSDDTEVIGDINAGGSAPHGGICVDFTASGGGGSNSQLSVETYDFEQFSGV